MNIIILSFLISIALLSTHTNGRFIVTVMNDVHLDLKYDPNIIPQDSCQIGKHKSDTFAPYGRKGCDSPYSLFKSTLEKMKEVTPSPDLIVVPGDMVTHMIPSMNGKFDPLAYQELKFVISNYTASMKEAFPNTPIVFTQGNDDYVINYQVPDKIHKDDYYSFIYDRTIAKIPANHIADTEKNKQIFKQTGCYSMELPQGVLVLSINGMQFSRRNLEKNDPEAPSKIFAWFEQNLAMAQAQNKKVILTYHIPHGTFITPVGPENFWVVKHEETLRGLLTKYSSVISAIFSGHIHISSLSTSEVGSYLDNLFAQAKDTAAHYYGGMVVNRGVSPIFVNNPGFTVFYYIDTMDYPKFYDEYTFLLPESYNKTEPASKYWVFLYNSRNDLQIEDLSSKSIHNFFESLAHDLVKLLKYMIYMLGDKPDSAINAEELMYLEAVIDHVCKKSTEDSESYIMCVDTLKDYLKEWSQH